MAAPLTGPPPRVNRWPAICYTVAVRIFTRKTPWYAAGLAFECARCGRCCAGPHEGYVWVNAHEIAAIGRHLAMPEDQVHRRYVRKVERRYSLIEQKQTRDCVFLGPMADEPGTMGCRIYPVRPVQCRTWPFWASNLTSADAWAIAQARCPGINRGQLFSREEIEARVRATSE